MDLALGWTLLLAWTVLAAAAGKAQYGEFYDLKKYEHCRKHVATAPNDHQCDYLKLTRRPQPEYWPFPDVAKPALPASAPSVYKRGFSAREHFKALCEAEAGEFIRKTVTGVDGIYQIRPRLWATTFELQDRFVLEDPYGYTEYEARNPEFIFVGPKKYRFFEAPLNGEHPRIPQLDSKYRDSSYFAQAPAGSAIRRYAGYEGRDHRSMRKEYDQRPRARYGYTWREIERPHDREHGIAGGELIVVDLLSNEVLGIRRGFAMSGNVRNVRSGIQWELASVCPTSIARPETRDWPKDFDFTYWFVSKVLRPQE